jgi:DNA-directed RNA polymerase I, II, and III subunit RPABC2
MSDMNKLNESPPKIKAKFADSDDENSDEEQFEEEEVNQDDEEEDIEEDDEDNSIDGDIKIDEGETKITMSQPSIFYENNEEEEEEDDDDEEDESYLQKFKSEINKKYLIETHPECVKHNDDEIQILSTVIRDDNNQIIDDLHRTLPYLTKYEKTRILGVRTKQINEGAPIFVEVDSSIIDGYIIAEKELMERKIPFIIRRPIPNGGSEYWKVSDLEILY